MVGDADIAFPRILVLPDISRPELDGLGPRVAVVSCFVVIFEGGISEMYALVFLPVHFKVAEIDIERIQGIRGDRHFPFRGDFIRTFPRVPLRICRSIAVMDIEKKAPCRRKRHIKLHFISFAFKRIAKRLTGKRIHFRDTAPVRLHREGAFLGHGRVDQEEQLAVSVFSSVVIWGCAFGVRELHPGCIVKVIPQVRIALAPDDTAAGKELLQGSVLAPVEHIRGGQGDDTSPATGEFLEQAECG